MEAITLSNQHPFGRALGVRFSERPRKEKEVTSRLHRRGMRITPKPAQPMKRKRKIVILLSLALAILANCQAEEAPEAPALTLSKTWKYGISDSKGSLVARDLKDVLTNHGEPAIDLQAHPDLRIYKAISYLMPMKDAVVAMKLPGVRSKSMLGCPGWPSSSFCYYSFDGLFEGHYNRLLMVVDAMDKVVAVELVDETPRDAKQYTQDAKWHAYDFVQTQTKLDATCRIAQWVQGCKEDGLVTVASQFYGKPGNSLKDGISYQRRVRGADGNVITIGFLKLQEDVLLFLPRPMVNLLLYCLK